MQQLADSFPLASIHSSRSSKPEMNPLPIRKLVRDKLNEAAAKDYETASDAGTIRAQLDQLVQQSSQQIRDPFGL